MISLQWLWIWHVYNKVVGFKSFWGIMWVSSWQVRPPFLERRDNGCKFLVIDRVVYLRSCEFTRIASYRMMYSIIVGLWEDSADRKASRICQVRSRWRSIGVVIKANLSAMNTYCFANIQQKGRSLRASATNGCIILSWVCMYEIEPNILTWNRSDILTWDRSGFFPYYFSWGVISCTPNVVH